MRHGNEYIEALKPAAAKSVKWGFLRSAEIRPFPEVGKAADHLELVGFMVDGNPMDSLKIRLSCGQIHSWLFRNLQVAGVNCAVTIGDVEVDGKLEYGTSYQKLKQEARGAHRDGTKPYPFHVWLTFPDLHIIDATFFVYKYWDRLPEPWKWSDYLICSDHPFAQDLNLRYVPMLVGDSDLIDGMIYK